MKLTFTFSDTADIGTLTRDDLFPVNLELPDESVLLRDCRERILAIAECVGQLTNAVLHISCKELALKHYPIKTEKTEANPIRFSFRILLLRFERLSHNQFAHRNLKIVMPVSTLMPVELYTSRSGTRRDRKKAQATVHSTTSGWAREEDQKAYAGTIDVLATHCLSLLNSEPPAEGVNAWKFAGFNPSKVDNALITASNNRSKRRDQELRKSEREDQRRKERAEQLAQKMAELGKPPTTTPQTGAGRRVGAVPGIFMGITFRSQLEIRFVTQLEAKKIRWIYEGERLGEGQYLVDFYLPDLKCWVEVKGRMEARDEYLLKEASAYLKRERGERLFMYTQNKAYRVNAHNFLEITHDDFWANL